MKTILIFLSAAFLSLFYSSASAQSNTQIIKGTVLDKQSQTPLPGVNIILISVEPPKAAVTDMDGHFKLTDVSPGRYDIKITYLGYKELVMPNVVVTSGKEVSLDIGLEENITALNEVLIAGSKKNETGNELSTVSGRSFSMEEVNRYAG